MFGNFDFEGTYAGKVLLYEAANSVLLGDGVERGDRAVDGDLGADSGGWAKPRHLEATGQPLGGLLISIFGESSEFSPPGGAGKKHHFAMVDAPKSYPHGYAHHDGPLLQVSEGGAGCGGGTCIGGHSSTLLVFL